MAATGHDFALSRIVSGVSSIAVSRIIAFASLSKEKVFGATATQEAAPMQRFLSIKKVVLKF